MIAATEPASMTAEERRRELADILARGLVGHCAGFPSGNSIDYEILGHDWQGVEFIHRLVLDKCTWD